MATRVIAALTQQQTEAARAQDFAMLETLRVELQRAERWKEAMAAELTRHARVHRC